MSAQGTPSKPPGPVNTCKGPLRATIPIASVLRQSRGLKSSGESPTGTYKRWPEAEPPSGQRSPGSVAYKGKSKANHSPSECSSIRRTASLDTIYLKGHWPRDIFYWHTGTLQIDKATQTEESDMLELRKIHCISETEENKERLFLRQKIRNKESHNRHGSPSENTLNTSSQTLSSCIVSPTATKAHPVAIPVEPRAYKSSAIRSSVEGLNQEIEGIVLRESSHSCRGGVGCGGDKSLQVTPEGHRAPLAEMFRSTRSRSVNTQTPQDFGGSVSNSSGESEGSSPDQETSRLGSSPHINKFLAREPPDGCEKVQSKSLDDRRPSSSIRPEHAPQPCTFKLKPSLGSAFQILQPSAAAASTNLDQDLPLVPPHTEMNQ